ARKRRALNIIIREEKNNVYFGELMAGAGGPDRHLAQADVFRFNRRTNNYLFAGSNNVERELLSFRSMMRLIGGDQLFSGNGFKELSNLSMKLAPPLFAQDGKNQLVALGINQDVAKRSTLDLYGLLPRKVWSGQRNNTTVFRGTGLEESSASLQAVRQQFGMLRATLTSKFPKQLVIRSTAQLHGTTESRNVAEDYRSNLGDRTTNQTRDLLNYEGQLSTSIVKRYEAGHLLKFNASGRRAADEETLRLTSDTTFLGSLLTFTDDQVPPAFTQENIPVVTNYALDYRYHHRLSRKVYLEHGTAWQATRQRQNITASLLPEAMRTTDYRQLNTDIGTVMKWGEADAVFRLHLAQPYGFDDGQRVFSSSYLLPEARVSFRSGPGSTVEARWYSQAEAPELSQLTAGPLVTSFTSYQFGLDTPRPNVSHSASLNYRFYNPIKGFGYDLSASFGQQGGPSIISQLSVLGVDRSISYLAVQTPGRSWTLTGGLRKDLSTGKLRLTANYRNREQLTLVDGEVIVSPVASTSLRGSLSHDIGKRFDLEWWWWAERSTFAAAESDALYNGSLTSEIEYHLGRWSAEIKTSGQWFDLTATAAFAGRIQGNIRYLFDKSPWALELSYSSPIGGRAYRNFRQSDLFFITNDTQVFVAFINAGVAFQF
ncbi:MAG: hypothetical protein AAF597_09935, partial [Bacteroidota bacterium]